MKILYEAYGRLNCNISVALGSVPLKRNGKILNILHVPVDIS